MVVRRPVRRVETPPPVEETPPRRVSQPRARVKLPERNINVTRSILGNTTPHVYGGRNVIADIGSFYYNSSTKYIYLGAVFAYGEQDSVSNLRINGELTSSISWADGATHVGDGTTALSTYLTSSTSGWTAADTTLFKGFAHAAIRIDVRTANLPGSFEITADLGGRKVQPIGGGTAALSSNPVECTYDTYISDEWRGLATTRLNTASWQAVADWCDDVMSDASARYEVAAIIDDSSPRAAADELLKTCHAETYIGPDGDICLWAEMMPPAITGTWTGTGSGGTTALTSGTGAATTDLEVGQIVIAGTTVASVTVVTHDDNFTIDAEVTLSAESVRACSTVYIKKHNWDDPPVTFEGDKHSVPDKYRLRFPNVDGRGDHKVTSTYGAGTDKIAEDSAQCANASSATRIAETELKIENTQRFFWRGSVPVEIGAQLEPGDIVLFDDDLFSGQAARVQEPIEPRGGEYRLTLRKFEPAAYSEETAVTDTVPNIGASWGSDDPIFIETILTLYSGTEYDVVDVGSTGTTFGGNNVSRLYGASVKLEHDTFLYGMDSGSGVIGLLKVNSSNETQLGDGSNPIYLMSTQFILDASGTVRFDHSSPKVALGWTSATSLIYLGSSSNRTDVYGTAIYLSPVVSGNVYIQGATTHLGATTQIEMTNNDVQIYGRESGGSLVEMLKVDSNNDLLIGDTGNQTQFAGAHSVASDPGTSHWASGRFGVHKNSSSGAVFFAYNDGGTIKKVALT